MTPPRVRDARAMSRLSLGHVCTDICQGAVPALLPTLIAERGLSLGAATALVSVASIGSAVIQPIFGIWADRLSVPLLAPMGVAISAIGLGAVGFCHSYLALALVLGVSGLGVALFHPEGARMAGFVGGGSVRGMSYFSVGGNVGFALGPALVLLIVGIGGLAAAPLLALPGLIAAALLLVEVERLKRYLPAPRTRHSEPHEPAAWGPFSRLAGAAVARTAAFFALLALAPIYLIDKLGASHSLASVALVVMLSAGAIGTLVGGRFADRFGRRTVLVWGMLPLSALLIVLPHVGLIAFFVVLVGVGFTIDGPFSTTVVLGQEYLPGRSGLASGITLGLAIGLGGLLAAGLGALADATSVSTTLLVLPAFTAVALLLALSLPGPSSAVDQPAVGGAAGFHDGLGQGGVAVDDARELGEAALERAHVD
jgi:FSR family fosmidomycin resistance protein-like MFS transporter